MTSFAKPSREKMSYIFQLCRENEWVTVLSEVEEWPAISTTAMIMDNHISTTIIHQAVTSKGNTQERAEVIRRVLTLAPKAAKMKNGYGSLPLHVISQRNTKMDSKTKEALIYMLMDAYPRALMEEGGVGRRTPLHIAFTDYISPRLARSIIERGLEATRMVDKKKWLPIHVACSRHCSPEKLNMLLEAYPESLNAMTGDGKSLLHLAKKTATKSHPNYALIAELEKHMGGRAVSREFVTPSPVRYPKQRSRSSRSRIPRKRNNTTPEAANLLLHFSRQGAADTVVANTYSGSPSSVSEESYQPYPAVTVPTVSEESSYQTYAGRRRGVDDSHYQGYNGQDSYHPFHPGYVAVTPASEHLMYHSHHEYRQDGFGHQVVMPPPRRNNVYQRLDVHYGNNVVLNEAIQQEMNPNQIAEV